MCEALATSREHAPPLCVFPEQDVVDRDLRRNLVTVPSCDRHNGKKCGDDEFLQAVILMMSVAASEVAKPAFLGKYLRAVKRKPHVYKAFFDDKGTLAQGKLHALKIDRQRFDRCIDHLVRALFFDAFLDKWTIPILVASPQFYKRIESDKAVVDALSLNAVEVSRQFLRQSSNRGHNPEVFQYRIRSDPDERVLGFAAIFFEFFEVFAFSSVAISPAG